MHIAVVGSTGRTGLEIVQQALARQFNVRAWARTPEKMTLTHTNLRVDEIDVLQSDLNAALQDVDAVIVSLGGAQLKDASTRSQGTKRLIDAMQKQGVQRIVIISSAGVGESFNQLDPQGQHVVQTIIKEAVEDHGRQEDLTRQSNLKWTILRPGGLSTEPLTPYDTDTTGTLRIGRIPRAAVADLALSSLENPDSIGKTYTLKTR